MGQNPSSTGLEPAALLAAYRRGFFPMPAEPGGPMVWWSPDPRGVLELDDLIVHRSLRQIRPKFQIRIDTAFEAVIEACSDPARPSGWIDERIRSAYIDLHRAGYAHSVEAWLDAELAGGLYGVSIGGLFAGESMFHRVRDASKVALVALVEGLRDQHRRLIDVQWATPHLRSLGAGILSRRDYLDRLPLLLASPAPAVLARPGPIQAQPP